MGGSCCGNAPEGLPRGVWGYTEVFGGAPEMFRGAQRHLGLPACFCGWVLFPPPGLLHTPPPSFGWGLAGRLLVQLGGQWPPSGYPSARAAFGWRWPLCLQSRSRGDEARPCGVWDTPTSTRGSGNPKSLGRWPSLPPPPRADVGSLTLDLQQQSPHGRSKPWGTTGGRTPAHPTAAPRDVGA